MKRNSSVRLVKPMLENLEERVQPSFLLSGTVQQQLLPPLQALLTDMQTSKTNLQNNFTFLTNPSNQTKDTDPGEVQTQYAAGAANYAGMLYTQHAINATVTVDIAFIRAAAMAELTTGDTTDAILLAFGPLLGFNPTSSLTNVQTQGNNLINGPDVQTWIKTDFSITIPGGLPGAPSVTLLASNAPWDVLVRTPSF
jgi:hypothetical protein